MAINPEIKKAFRLQHLNHLQAAEKAVFPLSFLALALIVWSYNLLGFDFRTGIILALVPLVHIALINFNASLLILYSSFFVNFYIYYTFTPATLAAGLASASFLLTHTIKTHELKNKISFALILFLLSLAPSLLKSVAPLKTIILSQQITLFGILITLLGIKFREVKYQDLFIRVFLLFAFINSLHLIGTALITGQRVFGFAGIMFVDYAGISLTVLLTMLIYSKKHRVMILIFFIVILTALILTQTRNAWLTTIITFILLLTSYIRNSDNLAIKTKRIGYSLILLITIGIGVLLTTQLNPEALKRVEQLKGNTTIETESDLPVVSTLATRMFIWLTAYEAFINNPILGVGLYTFPFASREYSKLSPVLYELFVENLSPHHAILQILTETGVVGFLGFAFFVITFGRIIRQNLTFRSSARFDLIASVNWAGIYLLISMLLFTDAWLWGSGLILWAIITALIVNSERIAN